MKGIDILSKPSVKKASVLALREKYAELATAYKAQLIEIEKLQNIVFRKAGAHLTTIKTVKNVVKHSRESLKRRFIGKNKTRHRRYIKHRQRARKRENLRAKEKVRRLMAIGRAGIKRRVSRQLRYYTRLRRRRSETRYRKGIQRGIKIGLTRKGDIRYRDVFGLGFKAGRAAQRERSEGLRRSQIKRFKGVDAVIRSGILVAGLSRALSMKADYLGLFLLMGEHVSFTFTELRIASEEMGDSLFYHNIYFMKDRQFIRTIGTFDRRLLWALTPLGQEIYKRAKSYILKNFRALNK